MTCNSVVIAKLKMLFSIFLIGFVIVTMLIYFFQHRILFLPEVLLPDHQFEFEGEYEEINYATPSGYKINALHFKSENPKGIVFFSHGNAGSLKSWGYVAELFLPHHYDLLIYDYRGYGKSGGKPTEANLYADANLIYEELTKSFDENEIIIYGRSIGTGIASYVAQNHNPKHLILESPYYNITDLAKKIFPFIPSILIKYKLKNNEMLPDVKAPITIFHGTFDEVIYFGSSMKLEKLLKDGDKLIPIVGGHHNDLANFEEYHKQLADILK